MDKISCIESDSVNENNYIMLSFDGFSDDNNISMISQNVSKVIVNMKEYSIFKIIFWVVLCCPFIKLFLKVLDRKTKANIYDNVLNNKEKKIISLCTLLVLLFMNLLIIFTVREYHLKVCLFFINNLFLLIFSFDMYLEEYNLYSLTWKEIFSISK